MPDPAEYAPEALYAKVRPRIAAVVIDMGVVVGFVLVMVVAASSIPALLEGNWFGILFIVALNLYEPLAVSLTGGTVGHHARNLRVQRLSDGRNLNVFVAFARWWLKWFFGIFSFVSMVLTRRYQALHDVVTRSVVTV